MSLERRHLHNILHPIQSNNIVVLFRFGSNCIISKCQNFKDIRHKVRKVQHQYPEFGHIEGEIKENLHKNTLTFKGRGEFSEFHPTFPFFRAPLLLLLLLLLLLFCISQLPPSLSSLFFASTRRHVGERAASIETLIGILLFLNKQSIWLK